MKKTSSFVLNKSPSTKFIPTEQPPLHVPQTPPPHNSSPSMKFTPTEHQYQLFPAPAPTPPPKKSHSFKLIPTQQIDPPPTPPPKRAPPPPPLIEFPTLTPPKNSPSMKFTPTEHQFPTPPPKRSSPPPPLVEFPTSPQLILGAEIIHFTHPQHPLSQVDLPDLFTCASCKEYGAGKRYTCPQCDFQLHDFCALAPPALKSHPLHFQHKLLFYSKPVKGGILKPKCDVCAKSTKGSAFRCTACSFLVHPCCSLLSTEIEIPAHPHTLKILPLVPQYSSNGDQFGFACGECNRKRSGRLYQCTVCDYHLHAVCAKTMINGLQESGFKGVVERSSVLGTAARVASQVVIEFIGGLMEGIGEGVGQVLIQSVTREGKHQYTKA